ncbi:MAG: TetR family transcriptional regulator [Solirubrobacteraceae bacterium]
MTQPPARNQVDVLARRVAKTSQRLVGVPKPRRTQAERRASTKAALLDATLASLVEDGYANMTTRRIADRAGVSQGTQQHYFKAKSELVLEAMRHASRQLAAELLERVDVRDIHEPGRREALLDEIWRIHQSDAFKAALELWIAARTDPELRRNMRRLEREVTAMITGLATTLRPNEEQDPQLLEALDTCLSAARGYAMLAPVLSQAELNRRWAKAREQLLEAMLTPLALREMHHTDGASGRR